MSLLHRLKSLGGRLIRRRQHQSIYARFKDFTMIPEGAYCDNLELAERVHDVPGCVVECGVWRGGMIAGIASVLGQGRRYYLLDSFEGLPPAQSIDGPSALQWQSNTVSADYYDNCKATPDFAERAMKLASATHYSLVKGWYEDTLASLTLAEPIALLRLDADWYDSTQCCLNHLFDRVAVGGLIVLDDYYTWDGCSRAVHDFLSKRSATERIRSLRDVCYFVKAQPPTTT